MLSISTYSTFDKLVKRSNEAPRWLEKKVDIQGVEFFAGSRPYKWYVVGLQKTYNEGDRPFYDAITFCYLEGGGTKPEKPRTVTVQQHP